MNLFRYTINEYDKMFIRSLNGQKLLNRLSQQGVNLIYANVNRDGITYTRNDVGIMIRFLHRYFFLYYNNELNDIFCIDANNNSASLNDIVIECFHLRS
jgi:hypothetical protein